MYCIISIEWKAWVQKEMKTRWHWTIFLMWEICTFRRIFWLLVDGSGGTVGDTDNIHIRYRGIIFHYFCKLLLITFVFLNDWKLILYSGCSMKFPYFNSSQLTLYTETPRKKCVKFLRIFLEISLIKTARKKWNDYDALSSSAAQLRYKSRQNFRLIYERKGEFSSKFLIYLRNLISSTTGQNRDFYGESCPSRLSPQNSGQNFHWNFMQLSLNFLSL